MLDQLRFQECPVDAFENSVIHVLLPLKAQLHLGGMDIYVDLFPVHMKMQHHKGESVLHGKVFISVFQRF